MGSIQEGRERHEAGPAHRHSVHPAPAGAGHRPGAGGAVRGVPPDHPAGRGGPVPGGDSPGHRPGGGRRDLHSGGLPGGPHRPHRAGDAGHPGGPAEPGQRQRHQPLCSTHGEAVRRGGDAGPGGGGYPHRPVLLVPDRPGPQDRGHPHRLEGTPHASVYLPRPQGGVGAGGGALLPGVPLVRLVCVGLVPGPGGLPPVQAKPHDRSDAGGALSAPDGPPA